MIGMFVTMFDWIATQVFKQRRVIVHLRGGQTIKVVREKHVSVDYQEELWRGWQASGVVLHFKYGRKRTVVRSNDVVGVEIR